MGVRLFCNRALVWCFAGIDYKMLELGFDGIVLGIRTLPMEPHSALMCLDSLRLPSCARNPHISSGRSGAQQDTKVLVQEFWIKSPQKGICLCFIFPRLDPFVKVMFHYGAYKLVSRGTQMPYSAAVDLVTGLGASQLFQTASLGAKVGINHLRGLNMLLFSPF
ncbi:hypothetical protein M9H77_23150 [Catharanthus roseus]|uniref:Uncharacterized protein n=1 Tax=Catharanthus roseus TaxID=4058 RepID=A0ACC0AV10_CATRO|nr:hypothetical protein M9H77_23150 [Catharanthus roseus]